VKPWVLKEDNIPDNLPYKEWCMRTFNSGEQIYEAYKEIAFSIDYHAEPPKTDCWQTPIETLRSKQGDCEDSVFLFFSQLSELDIDGDIVWGWVVDKNSSVAFAHVWYQLFDKCGSPYIVEGFSKEWNGIIPSQMVLEREKRIPTLAIRHNKIHYLADDIAPVFYGDSDSLFTGGFEDMQFPPVAYFGNNIIVREIFQKLQEMLIRYSGQKVVAQKSQS
jgi:hypothetical protein